MTFPKSAKEIASWVCEECEDHTGPGCCCPTYRDELDGAEDLIRQAVAHEPDPDADVCQCDTCRFAEMVTVSGSYDEPDTEEPFCWLAAQLVADCYEECKGRYYQEDSV